MPCSILPESSHSYSPQSPPVEALYYGFRFEAEFFQEIIHFLLHEILESNLVFNLNFIVLKSQLFLFLTNFLLRSQL